MDTTSVGGVDPQPMMTLSGHHDIIFRIAWSLDGKYLASPAYDTTIKIWDTETGVCVNTLQGGHHLKVNSVAWWEDSRHLVSCGSDGIIALWDLLDQSNPTRTIIAKLKDANSDSISLFDIAWASGRLKGGILAAAGKDGNVYCDFASTMIKGLFQRLGGINAFINNVAWSPDETLLAAGCGDHKVRLWRVGDEGKTELINTIDAQYSPVNSIAWFPDSKKLVSVGRQMLKVWNIHGTQLNQQRIQVTEKGFIKSVTCSYDGTLLAAKCQSSTDESQNVVHILNANTLAIIKTIPEKTLPKAGNGIAFHPSKPILATQGKNDTVIRLWNLTELDTQVKNNNQKTGKFTINIDDSEKININSNPSEKDNNEIEKKELLNVTEESTNDIKLPPWIFGIHDPGEWRKIVEAEGKTAWVMFHEVVGHDPNNVTGNYEFSDWSKAGHGVLVRLVNAPFDRNSQGDGTIPDEKYYEDFAKRCANFVSNSPGCKIWFIGNHMNISWHWPNRNIPISPKNYAKCFKLVRNAIKEVQPDAWVIPSGLHSVTKSTASKQLSFQLIDAFQWFLDFLKNIDKNDIDGFDFHYYFDSLTPNTSHYSYQEFLRKIPNDLQEKPVFLTAISSLLRWSKESLYRIPLIYEEINKWNQRPDHRKIYAALLYRWKGKKSDGSPDTWNLVNKLHFKPHFREVLKHDYRWSYPDEVNVTNDPISENLEEEQITVVSEDNNENKTTNIDSQNSVDSEETNISEDNNENKTTNIDSQTSVDSEEIEETNISEDNNENKTTNIDSQNSVDSEEIEETNISEDNNEDKTTNIDSQTSVDSEEIEETNISEDNNNIQQSEPSTVSIPIPKKKETEQIQALLTQAGKPVKVDGDYGQKTQKAVQEFQREIGLTPDGIATPSIIQLLKLEPPSQEDEDIRIRIGPATVNLAYKGNEYSNPNLLADSDYVKELKIALVNNNWKKYGELLFGAIINDQGNDQGISNSVLQGYRELRQGIEQQKLRIELDIDPNLIDLHHHKWEYLKDTKEDSPLAVYERSPFYRSPKYDPIPTVEAKPLKILVVICNPSTLEDPNSDDHVAQLVKINVEREIDILNLGLKRLEQEGLIEYTILASKATFNNLIKEFREGSYHILHIVAHGFFWRSEFRLVMENEEGKHDYVDAERFKSAILPKNLRLVVLASCQTAQTDTGKNIRGLGARLSNLGVPAVIAMQDLVPMPTAQLFTQYFYDHLARSGRIDMAMAATRFDLYDLEEEEGETGNWGIPVLFMSSSSGQLFEVDRKKASEVAPLEPKVKTYDQLPGQGDPSPRLLNSDTENLTRQDQENSEQFSLSSSRDTSLPPNTPPLSPPQDRLTLNSQIPKLLKDHPLDAKGLENNDPLSLLSNVYGQIASALNTGKHIIFIGPPGTGKTTIANAICQYVEQQGLSAGYTLTTATADWTTFDTIGGYVPTPQQTLQFRLGLFLRAIAEGKWLVIDEINRSDIDKALGELFTVLSGQKVDLPYHINKQSVSILPANEWENHKDDPPEDYNYIIHPNWRVIGTMNVYDKASLFNLSFALMRRFAFIEIDVPDPIIYQEKLLDEWLKEWPDNKKENQEKIKKLKLKLLGSQQKPDEVSDEEIKGILKASKSGHNPLMTHRAIGPAIIKDMMAYIGDRYQPDDSDEDMIIDCLGEAFLLYISPQLDGMSQEAIIKIHKFVEELFKERGTICKITLNRIELFYPHINWREINSS